MFGVKPLTCALIWEDLKTTVNNELDPSGKPLLPVTGNMLNPRHFLMALHHLKKYPTDLDREGPWDISMKTGRQWVKFYVLRLQALKSLKIVWPADWGPCKWIISVDGTHCWIDEPLHPELAQDPSYSSHKFKKAALNYELGISLHASRLVWMNGPFKAGIPDGKVFWEKGLKRKLRLCQKKAIGDRGYSGHPDVMSWHNRHDARKVKRFKSRVLRRHETFNCLIKRYRCLRGPFRHGADSFAYHFEAICVLCQYEIEFDTPLFDVLIEDIMP
jgi:DDE superfamily endonuclease